jgi:rhomboid-related protein 1/2/3
VKGEFIPRTCFALQYDPEGFGEIPWDDFLEVLNNPEFTAEVDANKRDILLERAQERSTTAITFQDFVNVVSL